MPEEVRSVGGYNGAILSFARIGICAVVDVAGKGADRKIAVIGVFFNFEAKAEAHIGG